MTCDFPLHPLPPFGRVGPHPQWPAEPARVVLNRSEAPEDRDPGWREEEELRPSQTLVETDDLLGTEKKEEKNSTLDVGTRRIWRRRVWLNGSTLQVFHFF